MAETGKARAVGINHVAIEVGDIEAALSFYGRLFAFELRGRSDRMAFIDMGDQFLALAQTDAPGRDGNRHIGLVVDDRDAVRRALDGLDSVEVLPGRGLDFLDPWGNRIQVVEYRNIQFAKTPEVLTAMGLDGLEKSEAAKRELAAKGIQPR